MLWLQEYFPTLAPPHTHTIHTPPAHAHIPRQVPHTHTSFTHPSRALASPTLAPLLTRIPLTRPTHAHLSHSRTFDSFSSLGSEFSRFLVALIIFGIIGLVLRNSVNIQMPDVFVSTHAHTRTHTHAYTCTHAYIHTHTYARWHTCVLAHVQTHHSKSAHMG